MIDETLNLSTMNGILFGLCKYYVINKVYTVYKQGNQ